MADKIILYGTNWCGGSRRTKKLFDDNKIEYQYIDIDKDKSAQAIVEGINHGNRSVPTIVFPDGTTMTEPAISLLAEKLGVEAPTSLF